jgi:uncharacterized protein
MKVIVTFIVLLIILSILSFRIGLNSCKKKLIEVRKSDIHNKGVFSNYDIKKGDLVEVAPYIIINDKTPVLNYVFFYTKKKYYCFVLGYGSMYNHSADYNLDFYVNDVDHDFEYYAKRDIKKGEELFINYGSEFWTSRKINPY